MDEPETTMTCSGKLLNEFEMSRCFKGSRGEAIEDNGSDALQVAPRQLQMLSDWLSCETLLLLRSFHTFELVATSDWRSLRDGRCVISSVKNKLDAMGCPLQICSWASFYYYHHYPLFVQVADAEDIWRPLQLCYWCSEVANQKTGS